MRQTRQSLSVGVLVERRYLEQAQPRGLQEALELRGHRVVVIDPENALHVVGDDGWLEGLDVIVVRGRSPGLLGLLAYAEAKGVLTVNSRRAIEQVHNKIIMAALLAMGRIPIPRTFVGPVDSLRSQVAQEEYPLILKPIFGDNGRGLRVVYTPDDLTSCGWQEPVALAQRYLPANGYDLKLYGIAGEVWAVRKPAPVIDVGEPQGPALGPEKRKARLMPVTPALKELALRCAGLFGLELYGVDCIRTAVGPLVIEVNDFPNYSSIPEASWKLADYVVSRVQAQREQTASPTMAAQV
ncbi:MAG: ATP-grasp domain-containing protein [Chloroflexi bacterium]|nr:ATP-grasp domain-containing protein [Chloroflexota bacterium]